MNILALDCSCDTLCVAVRRDSGLESSAFSSRQRAKHPFKEGRGHEIPPGVGTVIVELDAGLRHAERLMAAIDYALAESGLSKAALDLIAGTSGPGSFTGLRIGASTVKGIALALGKPFILVPTLDCIAREREGECPIIMPVIDARRGQFYAAVYEHGARISDWMDSTLASLIALVDTYPEVLVAGPDADQFVSSAMERSGFRIAVYHRRPPARALLDLALERFNREGPSPSDLGPLYIRKSDAEELRDTQLAEDHGKHSTGS